MNIIVYGPMASGKTRYSTELLKHYGRTRLVDEWDGKQKLKDGDLALTNLCPPFAVRDARAVNILDAKRAIGI